MLRLLWSFDPESLTQGEIVNQCEHEPAAQLGLTGFEDETAGSGPANGSPCGVRGPRSGVHDGDSARRQLSIHHGRPPTPVFFLWNPRYVKVPKAPIVPRETSARTV
jgi:hypothetical protein